MQHVDMVGHQRMCQYSHMVFAAGGLQAFEIEVVMLFREEAGAAIITSSYYVEGCVWNIQAGVSWSWQFLLHKQE